MQTTADRGVSYKPYCVYIFAKKSFRSKVVLRSSKVPQRKKVGHHQKRKERKGKEKEGKGKEKKEGKEREQINKEIMKRMK